MLSKYVIFSIVTNPGDKRYYAKVQFSNFTEYELLDTGANVSCIGSTLAATDFSNYEKFVNVRTIVKTADGKIQKTLKCIN